MNVAVVTDPGQTNSYYRAIRPSEGLGMLGHRVLVLARREDDVEQDALDALDAADAVMVYRYHRRVMQRLVRRAREAGKAIIWDNDDDLTDCPSSAVEQKMRGALRSQQALIEVTNMLQLADVVTTPSPLLAEQYRSLGATDVRVIENHLAPEFRQAKARGHDGIVIGWVASSEHELDLRMLGLRDVLRRVIDAHQRVRVLSIGIDLGLARDRYTHVPSVDYRQLAALVADFDIGIAPIGDLPFNRARSNVKLKEYAGVGVPWLASPIGPYSSLGERQGGRLVPDDRWYEEIERLVLDPRARRRLAKRAARWATGETIEANAHAWGEALDHAAERALTRRERALTPDVAG